MTSPTPEPKVSAVIVSYNTRDLLRRAIRSVIEEYEVVVVDNASTDGSAEMAASEFPGVVLIRNQHNAGFGAANNQGIEASSGSLVLLLNSDAEAKAGAVAELARVFDDPSVVAAGGKLLHPDGRLQESAAGPLTLWAVFCEQSLLEKAFRRSRVFSPYWLSERLLGAGVSSARPGSQPQEDAHPHLYPPPQPGSKRKTTAERLQGRQPASTTGLGELHSVAGPSTSKCTSGDERRRQSAALQVPAYEVAQVMGACLMMRPVERFDERFFLYCEDTELCARLSRHGRILYVPTAEFLHELGSSSQTRWQAVARYNRGKELYFAIHRGRGAAFACFVLDRLGALLRMAGWAVAFRSGKAGLFWRVLTAPVSGPPRPGQVTG